MKKHLILLSALFFLASITLLAGGALAAQKGILAEVGSQQSRINNGVASGALSRSEAEILQGNLNYIRDAYNQAMSNGRIGPNEEMRLRGMLSENSQMIYKKKHNMEIRRLY